MAQIEGPMLVCARLSLVVGARLGIPYVARMFRVGRASTTFIVSKLSLGGPVRAAITHVVTTSYTRRQLPDRLDFRSMSADRDRR